MYGAGCMCLQSDRGRHGSSCSGGLAKESLGDGATSESERVQRRTDRGTERRGTGDEGGVKARVRECGCAVAEKKERE